jgi:integrase
VRYKDETTGKERQKWVTTDILVKGSNKRKAEAKLRQILSEYEQQKIDLSKDYPFTMFLKQWLENMKQSIEAVTYDTYKLIIYNQIIPFYEPYKLKVTDVTPMHIQMYVNFKLKTVSPNTVRKHLWNLSKCLDSAVRQNIIAFNPVKRIELPKIVKYTGAKHYNERQIEELLEVSKGDVLEDIIKVALFYGLRRSEIIGIKWSAVDMENDILTIKHTAVQMGTKIHKKDSTKTESSYRAMPIPDFMKNVFYGIRSKQAENKLLQPNDYIDDDYIFTHIDGRLITPNYVTKHFKSLLKNNALETTRFHDIRHSTASYLLHLGFDMKFIQMWLGHGDIGTTMNLYVHLDLEAKRQIANTL